MMQHDLALHTGEPGRPVIILIHGLGVNRHFWGEPDKCHVFGGLFPLTVFLSRSPVNSNNSIITTGIPKPDMVGLFPRLVEAGYSVAAWSQQQPLGPISYAVAELEEVLRKTQELWAGRPIILIGHSRGGLIAKKFLLDHHCDNITALITLASPHEGTVMAGFTEYLRPVAHILEKIIPKGSQNKMMMAFSRLADYLKSPATIELIPQSELIESIKRPLPKKLGKLSFGGTDPSLFNLYVRSLAGEPWNVFPFPNLLLKAIPSNRLPAELKPGLGDSLVTARSAILRGGEHFDIPINHVGIAYKGEVQDRILGFLK